MRRMCRKIGGIGLLAALAVALLACPVTAQDERVVDLTPESEEGEDTKAALTAEDILKGIEKEKLVERERDAFLSDTYTKSALALYDELEFEAARNEFTKALERGPNNIAAKEGLRKTETIIGLRDAKYNRILNQFVEEKQVELELAYHESKVAFAKAHELVDNREYAVALERLERVRELVKWISPYFDKDEMEPLRLRTEELITAAKDGEQARLEEERLERRRKADEVARMRASKAQERDELRIVILLKQGGDLLAEARYSEAQTLGESVLDLDPFNKEALALRDIAFEAGLAYNTAQTEKTLGEETRLTWLQARAAQIPHSRLMVYPDNWAEIIKRTIDPIGTAEGEDPAWMEELRGTLEERVTFDFVETPLRDVVAFLQQITGANIVLDEEAVAELANPDVTLKVTEMKLSLALDWVLDGVKLKYALQGESIYISTEQKVGGKPQLKLYDVTDVTLEVKDFSGNLVKLRDRVGTSVGGGTGGSTEVGADWEDWEGEKDTGESTFTPDRLIEFIKRTIAPGTWDDAGME